jgi:hypothetical protein
LEMKAKTSFFAPLVVQKLMSLINTALTTS